MYCDLVLVAVVTIVTAATDLKSQCRSNQTRGPGGPVGEPFLQYPNSRLVIGVRPCAGSHEFPRLFLPNVTLLMGSPSVSKT